MQAQPVERAQRQRGEDADPLIEQPVGVFERESDLGLASRRLGRIGNAPMRGHRLARPYRARFRRRTVADGEDEIEMRLARFCKFIPRLRATAGRVIAEALQKLDRVRIDPAFRLAAGAISEEMSRTDLVQYGLADDGARGISSAEEEHVIGTISHGSPYDVQQAEAAGAGAIAACGAQQAPCFSCATRAVFSPVPSP